LIKSAGTFIEISSEIFTRWSRWAYSVEVKKMIDSNKKCRFVFSIYLPD